MDKVLLEGKVMGLTMDWILRSYHHGHPPDVCLSGHCDTVCSGGKKGVKPFPTMWSCTCGFSSPGYFLITKGGELLTTQSSRAKEIPHVQGQRRSPSKMVGGVKLCLGSNSIPSETLRGPKHTLWTPGPRDPTEIETELCLSISWGGTNQQWTAAGAGTLGAVDLGIA